MTRIVSTRPNAGRAGGVAARAAQIGVMFVVLGALAFGAAGTLDWGWAWLWLAIYLSSTLINAWFLLRRDPDLVAERGRAGPVHGWDKALSGLWTVAQFLLLPLVAGLDVRLGWTGPIAPAWHVLGAVVFAVGLGLFGRAMVVNAYFSTASRIQDERGQTVCRDGPYGIVRHPGYAGAIMQSLGTVLLLGSLAALVPALAAVALITARTAFEDRMLRADLPGYAAYAREVRYRLVPAFW